eukprot:10407989-Ditylum_brightwellii.AAC.1
MFEIRTESKVPNAFENVIRDNVVSCAMKCNNIKMQTGVIFKKILHKYNVKPENTKPHYPQQNPAEHHIQDFMDRTRAQAFI